MEYNCPTELKVGFEIVRPCSMYVSTELEVCFDRARLWSRYVLTVLDECVCFELVLNPNSCLNYSCCTVFQLKSVANRTQFVLVLTIRGSHHLQFRRESRTGNIERHVLHVALLSALKSRHSIIQAQKSPSFHNSQHRQQIH